MEFSLDLFPDPQTEQHLLPPGWNRGDNTRRIRYCKKALHKGMRHYLSPAQRQQIGLYYGGRLSKSEIARRQGVSCSAVSKSLRTGQETLRSYVALYMEIFDTLEQDFLQNG